MLRTTGFAIFVVQALFLASCEKSSQDFPIASDREAVIPGTGEPILEDDPRKDGWQTEVFSAHALAQLKRVGKLLASPEKIAAISLEGLVDEDISASTLRPRELVDVFRDSTFVVRRWKRPGTDIASLYLKPEGFSQALLDLAKPVTGASEVRSKIKVVSVELSRMPITRAYFQLSGRTATGHMQMNSTWKTTWSPSTAGAAPRIRSVALEAHEEVLSVVPERRLFADCTEAVLGANPMFDRQLRPGIDHWLGRIPMSFGIDFGGWQGLAIGDVSGDGLDDVYVCQPGGLPNRLFIQNADGSATDRSAAAGVDYLGATHGALLVDLDNDADQDLLVGAMEGILVLSNEGNGKFQPRVAEYFPDGVPYSLAAADYDVDGDLDVYACCYNKRTDPNRHIDFPRPMPYHDANNGSRNVLLRNDGNWQFKHATKGSGLDENNRRFSYAAAWEDYDNDGDLDLYVANDFGRNNLYRNDGGRFRDVAEEAGVEDIAAGMSACWGDYDNDGDMDIYVSNMFSSAGNRIAYQKNFHSSAAKETLSQLQRHARGNTLFENLGDGKFQDVSVETGSAVGRWAWGSKFFDFNNDGWEDLIVANGFVTQEDTGDL